MRHILRFALISLILGSLILFAIGCDYFKLLEYDNEETYAWVDSGFMSPPSPSDIDKALKILWVPKESTPYRYAPGALEDYLWAIDLVVKTMDLVVIKITDLNDTYSINDLVKSLHQTFKKDDITISENTLRQVILHVLNESIRMVKEQPGDRLNPDKTPYFALGERLYYEFIIPKEIKAITNDHVDMNILDTASFVILSIIINQAVSEAINESINQSILDNYPKELHDPLLARGIPIRPGTPSYFAKQRLLKMNEELKREKQKRYDNIIQILKNYSDQQLDIHIAENFLKLRQDIKNQSANVVLNVKYGADLKDFEALLTVLTPEHQGIVGFGWSG